MTEHGWNDPPTFSFSALQSASGKKSQITKRVNHDITNQPPSNHHKRDASTQPPPVRDSLTHRACSDGPPPMTAFVKENKTDSEDKGNGEELGERESEDRTFDQVLESLTKLTEKDCETLQKRTLDEIKKRLSMLSKQWTEGRLSSTVQREMTKLTIALENGDYKTADTIHVALMADYTSEVSQWMVGVKRLIATLKST